MIIRITIGIVLLFIGWLALRAMKRRRDKDEDPKIHHPPKEAHNYMDRSKNPPVKQSKHRRVI